MTVAESTTRRLHFEDVRKSYGSTPAVAGLSLSVHSGEIVGLIGPDGAGKTTAMRIACALLLPDGGTIEVMERDVVRHPMTAKHHIGYMPQRFSLYPDLTVAENLRFFADLYEVPAKKRAEQEQRLMQFSRLEPFRNRRAGKLSGGMKQKLALSCTLIHTPEILILDEPTTGVDPLSRQEFWTILRELASRGHALLVSTPYMDEAELCDRVALMYRGRVLAAGTPSEVTGQFRRRLLEITGRDAATTFRRLSSEIVGDIRVNRFGERVHVVYDTDEQETWVRRQIKEADITVRAVQPTIEDVFVERMGRGEELA
ncbi:ABC transporter ATP-binding protein [bacterium]|nr:ABC transporter ATP-binding protein [bacterium]MBU1983292.1 ABC transporter ATP-binding protein [bacterium]